MIVGLSFGLHRFVNLVLVCLLLRIAAGRTVSRVRNANGTRKSVD
jgi:hypothetical protein